MGTPLKRLLLLVVAGLAWPGLANALELDYYTYNAFPETRDAFIRVALLFSDVNFLGFVFLFAVIGIVIGALMAGANGIAGARTSPLAWLFPVLIGMILFKGVVMPTGSLDIYDPTVNAFQRVDGVPDIVVLLAGGLNKIERSVVQMVDTAGGTPYSQDAGSIDFSLINAAMGIPISDVALDRSLSQYYADCGTIALATDSNGVSKQEFLNGTDDLYTTFAKFVNPAVYTVYYAAGNDTGTSMTCADAWGNISPLLVDGSPSFKDMKNAVCKVAGFDPTDAAQAARCETELVNASAQYGVAAANSFPFLRSVTLARSVSEALSSADFSLGQRMLVDRQMMAEGFGVAQAANQWVPKLRGFMTAAVLGLVPLVLLFVVTPLAFRALSLVFGLFIWLTLWGICDSMAVVMARDAAAAGFSDIQNFHFGYDAILNSPDAAIQALGVFGKARTMAMGLATVISGALFYFAGYAFTQIGQGMQAELDRAGGQAGTQTLLPEQRAALIQHLTGSAGPEAALATSGFRNMAFGAAQGPMREAMTGGYITERLAGRAAGSGPSGSPTGDAPTPILPDGPSVPRGVSPAGSPAAAGPGALPVEGTLPPAGAPTGVPPANPADDVTVVGRRRTSPLTPFGLLATQSAASTGDQVGTARARKDAAVDLSLPVESISEQTGGYETTFGTYSTLARRDEQAAVPGGVRAAARLMGGLDGARARVFDEVYGIVNPGQGLNAEGIYHVARQLEGSVLGVAKAGSTEDYIREVKETQRILMAWGKSMEASGITNSVGTARALGEVVQTKGFLAAMAAVGGDTLVMGHAWRDVQSGVAGEIAYGTAPIGDLARSLEQVNLASRIAQSSLSRQVAGMLGFDPTSVKGLVPSEEARQGHMGLTVRPELAERVLGALDKSGLIDQKDRPFLEKQPGFALDFNLADGEVLTSTITAGGRTFVSHSTLSVDYSKDLRGELATRDHLDDELLHAYGGNIAQGTPDPNWFWKVSSQVGAFASARGIRLSANTGQSLQVTAGGELKGQFGVAIPGGPGVGVTGGAGEQKVVFGQTSTEAELNTRAAAAIIRQERDRLIGDYDGAHAPGAAASADQHTMATALMNRVVARTEELYKEASKVTDPQAHRNDVIANSVDKAP
jgi:type IV secretory system conjugative DNA transfer VirD4/TraG family protein